MVALPLTDVDESLSSLRRNLAIGGIGLFAAQALVIAYVVRVVNRPVRRLSTTSHRIAEGDLDAVVPAGSGPREVADLADDLNEMVDRLRSTIAERQAAASEAERAREDMERFMADASHELRTPLTALKGFSELHAEGMLDDDGIDRAMARIGTESERLTTLVNDLLRLLRTWTWPRWRPPWCTISERPTRTTRSRSGWRRTSRSCGAIPRACTRRS